jgi:hypothetical protein
MFEEKKGAELYETKRRQPNSLILKKLSEAGWNPPKMLASN